MPRKTPKLPKPKDVVKDVVSGTKELARQGRAAVENVKQGVRKIKQAVR